MWPSPADRSRRDSPAAAYDEPYTFGRPPGTYLATRETVRLMILRAKLGERRSVAGTPRD